MQREDVLRTQSEDCYMCVWVYSLLKLPPSLMLLRSDAAGAYPRVGL